MLFLVGYDEATRGWIGFLARALGAKVYESRWQEMTRLVAPQIDPGNLRIK
jgi:hypothetical protein